MIYLKTDEEIELLRENNILVSQALAEVGKYIKPGVTTKDLNKIAEDFIRSHGAIPSFLGYEGYPASACISVNEQVVHGIPGSVLGALTGAIITERVYLVPGIGNVLTTAINKYDNGVIVGVTSVVSCVIFCATTIVLCATTVVSSAASVVIFSWINNL